MNGVLTEMPRTERILARELSKLPFYLIRRSLVLEDHFHLGTHSPVASLRVLKLGQLIRVNAVGLKNQAPMESAEFLYQLTTKVPRSR